MAIPADLDVTATPGPRMPVLECRSAVHVGPDGVAQYPTFRADRRPDPGVLDPWLDAHATHDPTLRDRAEEMWR